MEEPGPRTRAAAGGGKDKPGGDGGSGSESDMAADGGWSRPSALEGLLARRLQWVAEVDDVDRCVGLLPGCMACERRRVVAIWCDACADLPDHPNHTT